MSCEVTLHKGLFAHTPTAGALDQFRGAIAVDRTGKIAFVARSEDEISVCKERFAVEKTIETGENSLLLPGFVDTHAHAPQYAFAGA